MQAVIVALLAALLGGVLSVLLGPLFPMRWTSRDRRSSCCRSSRSESACWPASPGIRRAVTVDPALAFGGP